jgi:hypothetical protein
LSPATAIESLYRKARRNFLAIPFQQDLYYSQDPSTSD